MNIRQISLQLQHLNELDEDLVGIPYGNDKHRLRIALHGMTKQALKGSKWRLDYDYEFNEWVVAKRVA